MQVLEWVAAAFGIAFVIGSVREQRLAWIAYIVSCALYVPVLIHSGMFLYAVLQGVFIGMGLHAWFAWGRSGTDRLSVRRAPLFVHPLVIVGTAVFALPYAHFSGAANLPLALADAIISFGSVGGTVLSARKYTDSWIYWAVINLTAVAAFAVQGLVATTILYLVNLLLSGAGLFEWLKREEALAST